MSSFETLVYKVINREILIYAEVVAEITNLVNLTPIQRFYYTPILIVMLNLVR